MSEASISGIPAPQDVPPRNAMDVFIDGIELIAAFFVGIVALDIFVSVLLRYFFSVQIPDSYDFGRLLLGILIFWGIAATSYRGNHITVDLLYANVGPRAQRCIDVFATSGLLVGVTVQTYTLFDKVVTTRAVHVATFDLRRAAERREHLSPHFPSRRARRPISDQAGGMRRPRCCRI